MDTNRVNVDPCKTVVAFCLSLLTFEVRAEVPASADDTRASLPDKLYSCNYLPKPNCGYWVRNGAGYHGEYANGAIGEMTVQQFGVGSVVFTRKDVSGVLVGLTGTYRGTWDGHQIVDGVFSSPRLIAGSVRWTAVLPGAGSGTSAATAPQTTAGRVSPTPHKVRPRHSPSPTTGNLQR